VADSQRGAFQWHHRVSVVLDKAPVGAERWWSSVTTVGSEARVSAEFFEIIAQGTSIYRGFWSLISCPSRTSSPS
jgi:hypothetical protein